MTLDLSSGVNEDHST